MPPPPPPPKRKVDFAKLVGAIVTIIGLLAGIIVFVQSRGSEATVVYEPPLQPGPDPFTTPIDVPAAGVGAIIPTPTTSPAPASPSASPTPTGSAPVPGSTAGGGFGGSGFTTVCDRELLIRSLRLRPRPLAEWARIRGITPEAVPAYIRALRPATLAEATRVTNYAFKGGKANAFQSILPAGTAVLVDASGNVVTRCRCGNPLTEPKPIGNGTCKDCPRGFSPPPPLPRGVAPKVVVAINPPPVEGATPTPSPSPSPTSAPPSTNLSIGATAQASATFSSQWHQRFGIDSDPGTSWFSKGPEPEHNNTSTYTITLKEPSTLTRIEFRDNSKNHQDPSVRSGFGFRSWKIELVGADGAVINTVGPASDPLKSQTLRFPPQAGVARVRFIGSQHQDPTCGGFGALWVFGY